MPDATRTMLPWLAAAAHHARTSSGRLASHIAAEANMDQSAVSRFEHAKGWPRGKEGRGPDQLIEAYAADLDIHPIELWATALAMWRESLSPSREDPAAGFASAAEEATRPPHEQTERNDTPKRSAGGQGEGQ